MSFVNGLVSDLRDKRLWPVVAALLLALVAVPLLLSSSSSSTPLAVVPPASSGGPVVTGIPAVSVSTTPGHTRLTGSGRDPFTQQHVKASTTSTSSTKSTSAGGTAAAGSTGTSTTGSGGATAPATTTPTTTPTTTIPHTTPTPAIPVLSDTQSYRVAVSMTNGGGGVNAIDPLERLSLLPSASAPRLVELGVLKGGHRVLFAVQPGTVLSGPGACTPGPIDCEILSLGQNQTEGIGVHTSAGTTQLALFAVTAVKADDHGSVAAATKAREAQSAGGRAALNRSPLSALSLFRYDPSIGAVLDLRNLTVGGN